MQVLTATLLVVICSVVVSALPTSLIAGAQDAVTKVKRAEEEMLFGNQQNKPSASGIFYSSIRKRAAVQNDEVLPAIFLSTEPPVNQPEIKETHRVNAQALSDEDLVAHMRRGALDKDENSKTVKQYEKGYLYGVGKEALDKKAENSLLKSEVYGEPVNEYRYYGGGDSHRQERVTPKKKKGVFTADDVGTRLKRELELDPDSLLALISLLQSEQHKTSYPYHRERVEFPRYGYERQDDSDESEEEEDFDNGEYATPGEWLENPVPLSHYQYEQYGNQYPMVNQYGTVENYPRMRNAYYPPLARVEHKRGQWGGFAGSGLEKRFMVSKRRQIPQWEEQDLWSRVLASQPRDPLPGMVPRRRILL